MSDAIHFSAPDPNQPNPIPEEFSSAEGAERRAEAAGEEGASPARGAAAARPAVERRRRRRAMISAPVRVRDKYTLEARREEITTTIDVSRSGLLVLTQLDTYRRGMDVAVVFPYSKSPTARHAEQHGRIARVVELPDGRRAIAIALEAGQDPAAARASGRKLATPAAGYAPAMGPKKPLILAVDADDIIRDTMKSHLEHIGYNVIAVSNGGDAREVLRMFTPSLLIAEVEGEGMPGFDLCAHVKADRQLRHIPVVLTTRSGFPSDYSNAHALGAVVCMSKPYKQDRLGHVARLLAPLPPEIEEAAGAKRGARGFAGRKGHEGNGNGARRPRSSPSR